MDFRSLDVRLLLGSRENVPTINDDDLEKLISAFTHGKYEDCIKSELLNPLWKSEIISGNDTLEKRICNCVDNFLNSGEDRTLRELTVLVCGASALQLFVQNNWTGPPSSSFHNIMKTFISEVIDKSNLICKSNCNEKFCDYVVNFLNEDGTLYPKINSPEYLWLARVLLCLNLNSITTCQTFFWWALRCVHIYQLVLDEKSPTLRSEAISYIDKGMLNESIMLNDKYRRLQIEFHLECSSVFFCYFDTTKSKEHLNYAVKITGLDVSLTGALGKRTKFQENAKAQLKLNIKRNFIEENTDNYSTELPKDILLNDEVRREKISFENDDDNALENLSPEEQAVILSLYIQIQKTNPYHKLVDEELMAYLNSVISQPKVWSVQTKALFLRSLLEAKQRKSAERSMMQIEELVSAFSKSNASTSDRFYLFYSVSLPPVWKLEYKLADSLLNLGVIKSALEVYLRLEAWGKVITCYQILGRRSQAEEIIRQQLRVHETSNLWCTLGEVTDNIECYEKAWTLSNGRSARAQRCFGQHYFGKKEYEECIPYFKKSLELNHLQLGVSFNLAFAAMKTEDWECSASAYRHCLNLEPDNFQAWNNIANVYLKLKQNPRAWKALQEAIRCDFDNWRIWENYMIVSVDCRAFDEGIAAYHKLLELKEQLTEREKHDEKEKQVDIEILTILTKAVIEDLPGNDESSSLRLRPKLLQLFGRLTSKVINNSRVWDLYASLVSANCEKDETIMEKVLQFRRKAQKVASQQDYWEKNEESCEDVVDITLRLVDDHKIYWKVTSEDKKLQSLASVKLMLRGMSTKLKLCRDNNLTSDAAPYLQPLIEKLDKALDQ